MDTPANSEPVICEVCGAYFENRRGLSSHARLHLRQLGVMVTENSGSPIELLYQLIEEKDGSPEGLKMGDSASVSTPPKKPSVQEDANTSSKTGGRVLLKLQKGDHQGSPPRLRDQGAALLPSSPSALRPNESSSSSFSEQQTKPLWAPLETDAPITLASVPNDDVHVCQLCGSWYETRKGLSSHARAHLRQIGIPDSEVKNGPIEYLYQIMEEQNLKPISAERQEEPKPTSSSTSSSKRPFDVSSSPASTPSKRPKTSEDCTCVLCGEEFENRKGLGSHARSHLRHIGVSDLVGKSSAIGAVEELVSSGMLEPVRPPKPNSSTSSSAPPSPAAKLSKAPFSPSGFSPSPTSSLSPQPPLNRAPKAKKGFRLAVDPLHRKPKPEPIETEVFVQPKPSSTDSSSSMQKFSAAIISKKPSDSDVQSPPTVLCDFCGQLFDTRKALSCHVRAHLRQLGLTWSIRTSPIDLLREVMLQGEERKEAAHGGSSAAGKAPWSPQGSRRSRNSLPSGGRASSSNAVPVDYSMKDKSPTKTAGSTLDTSCELCGFDFENRKALASHARAHLRQLGIFEWRADGARSPIELLSELIRKDPNKVAEITRRYRFGDLYIKKSQRSAALMAAPAGSDGVPSSSQKSSLQRYEHKASRMDHSSGSVRTARGVHAPKHGVSSGEENWGANSRHPPRSGSIPALLPKPPLTPLVKLVGKIYSLKCRFCEEVFHGPLSVQEKWIAHLQKHILSLGYKGKEAPPASPAAPASPSAPASPAAPAPPAPPAPPAAPALVQPVAV
ncbi:protein Wiz-like isoform X2 [Kryptolebias marmoratus]|uniref:protein Wiz-like isoform X2 n=1 Tax=Kryptolebias marmoratus TaxID=37003 RepID=UPI0007F8D52C|nr:protein Wiz-like isoform X2 [Kryptolebias marmoratus]